MKLSKGDQAPDFEGKDALGNTIKLSDYQGSKLILYFYPKDDTSGCTAQACNLNENLEGLQTAGYQVLGVSTDSGKSHQKFITKYGLNFPLIADEDKKIVALYDVWKEKSMYGKKYMGTLRTTFIIDENGIITDIIEKVDTKNHTSQVLK
ncbi:MAG: thioredoxin-dependent thiol peroxidase [Verrucomicrobia bacterium]|nr:thioredoxin-dependent thiol peroxidase [Cytophagales bacterium]